MSRPNNQTTVQHLGGWYVVQERPKEEQELRLWLLLRSFCISIFVVLVQRTPIGRLHHHGMHEIGDLSILCIMFYFVPFCEHTGLSA